MRYTIIEDDEPAPVPAPAPAPAPEPDSVEARFRNYIAKNRVQLAIMTPCYNSTVFVSYMQSLISTMMICKEYNIKTNLIFCRNDSLVSRARNNVVAKAMHNKENTHFLFIDADITWSPLDIIKLIIADKPIVGGIYPIKNYKWDTLTSNNPKTGLEAIKMRHKNSMFKDSMTETDYIKTNLLRYNINYESSVLNVERNLTKVKHLATGFMMIQRPVFEMMFKAYPYTKYTDDVSFLTGDENDYAYALFDCGVENDHYYSEDWMFCHRWQKMGGEIFVDVTISLDHTGIETFHGCYLASVV